MVARVVGAGCERISRPNGSFRNGWREKAIPKMSDKVRRLGIATTADRIVEANVKLVLEPISESDFLPCSYGFRPRRGAQDAISETRFLASPSRNCEWAFEADIKACFDAIEHVAPVGRVRERVGDKRVLGWVKVPAGRVLTEQGLNSETITGTPQDGRPVTAAGQHRPVRSGRPLRRPLRALDPEWQRRKHRRGGHPAMKMVRYADDLVALIAGTRDAEPETRGLHLPVEEAARVAAHPMEPPTSGSILLTPAANRGAGLPSRAGRSEVALF